MATTDKFEFALTDRLRNVSLAPSQYNAMMPVIEAITNSIHSIEDRFKSDLSKGRIEVSPIYDAKDQFIVGFSVKDNGIGFNDDNYASFKRADSPHKEKRGGKGVGRLTWLKAFDQVKVRSIYAKGKSQRVRSFSFTAADDAPIFDYADEEVKGEQPGTEVVLHPYKDRYGNRLFKKESSIVRDIVRHFIAYLIGENHVRISFIGNVENIKDLHDEFFSEALDEANEVFYVKDQFGDHQKIQIHHFLIGKNFRDQESKGHNHIYLCGDNRPVRTFSIDSAVGLKSVRTDYVYISLVSGDCLDESVNQERTSFSMEEDDVESIRRVAIEFAKQFLSSEIEEIRDGQEKKTQDILKENPRFLSVARDVSGFVKSDLKLSQSNDEEIYLALTRRQLRKRREVLSSVRKVADSGVVDEAFETAFEKYRKFVTEESALSLADYVAKRRAVITAIEESRKFKDGTSKYTYEEAIHNFICPLRSTSDDLDYDQHNLWLLDDRLAFYSYFHSDRQIQKIVLDSDSSDEPDITFFDLSFGFERANTYQPVVIVEFKKPSRKEYTKEDPVRQVMRYVRQLRTGKIAVDKDGRDLSHITSDTQFHGIIVADLNNSLLEAIEATFVKQKTPDGLGRFGYDTETKTFIEIVPYQKLLADAKARNEAFFAHLGFAN